MRLCSFIVCLIISLQSYASSDFLEKKNELEKIVQDSISITQLDNFEEYSHYQDAEEVRKFITFAIDVLTEKMPLKYANLYLDYRFETVRHLPKKFFDPIVSGTTTFDHIFLKPNEKNYGVYGSYFAFFKKNNSEKWNRSTIRISVEGSAPPKISSNFTDEQFSGFGFIQKEKILLAHLNTSDWKKYIGREYEYYVERPKRFEETKNNCYALYLYKSQINEHKLNFYFCVAKQYYNEKSEYPNNWSQLIIERVD
ncbi:hypothetical protein [uncultured Actinobacillus sp.]|uniref:hypothetical protein n=1 Tax=uncultured Actinobacillus sp. TaxID=417616 RepID=UPI0025FB56FD|nr:hypothetical protein [uncultured Actinobacillus sp.]